MSDYIFGTRLNFSPRLSEILYLGKLSGGKTTAHMLGFEEIWAGIRLSKLTMFANKI